MTRKPPTTEPPLPRRERRAIERAERAGQKPAARRASSSSPLRSPMVLITAGALIIGLAIIVYAVLQRPGAAPPSADDLTRPVAEIPAGLSDGRTLGNADAPVTVEIWSDFQCPACRSLGDTTEPPIIADFVVPGTAKLVYRDAAFQGQRGDPDYDESVESAAAARCAADQGRFWEMHDWLFANWDGENEGAFRAERLRAIAGAAGLELGAYDSCMATGNQQDAVRAETRQAVASGINSTPTVIVNGEAFPGLLTRDQLAQLITQAAEGARTGPDRTVAAAQP